MSYKPSDWYWAASDGRLFSSARQCLVQQNDATYAAWLKKPGNYATIWPTDDTGTQSTAALQDVLTPYGLYVDLGTALFAYADAKQLQVLAALTVSCTLKDGFATLNSMCDDKSMTFLNSLAAWANMNAAANPAPTRVYYNLDGSAHPLTPAQMAEFLTFVGSRVQATFDALAQVRTAIAGIPASGSTPAGAPTIATTAEIDAFAWPTA